MATPVLLFANIAVFVLCAIQPSVMPNVPNLVEQGQSVSMAVWDGEFWRLLTAMFLHAGFLHLGMNMYGLYLLGPVLERAIGTWRFLVVYFVTGIFGFVVSLIFLHLKGPTLGASGAIFGLVGALIGNEMRVGRHAFEFLDQSYGRTLLGLVAINIVLGFTFPGINNAAHLGGLVCGLVLVQVGLVRQLRKLDLTGWMLRFAAAVLCVQLAVYSFFPVFNGYWQLYRAIVAERERDFSGRDAALERALKLNPGIAREFRISVP